MPFKKIGSPDPKYLAATDILISDMSNINYDFLLFNSYISKSISKIQVFNNIEIQEK